MATEEIEDVEGLPMEGEPEEASSQKEVEEVEEQEVPESAEPEKEAKAEKAEESAEEQSEDEDETGEPQRHKQTSKERREKRRLKERRIRDERDFLLQQVNDLTQRLSAVEGTSIQTRVGLVDSQMSECLNDAATAESLELDAQQRGDWEEVRQARRLREAAQERARLHKAEKERLAQYMNQRQTRPVAPSPGAAEIQRLSADFRADKPWLQFGPDGTPLNPETATALAIDHVLKKEGRLSEYEPDYWKELDRRVRSAIPHTFRDSEADEVDEADVVEEKTEVVEEKTEVAKKPVKTSARKGPAVGSSGAQAASGAVEPGKAGHGGAWSAQFREHSKNSHMLTLGPRSPPVRSQRVWGPQTSSPTSGTRHGPPGRH